MVALREPPKIAFWAAASNPREPGPRPVESQPSRSGGRGTFSSSVTIG